MGGTGRAGRRVSDERVHRFSAVGGERGDVDQRRHLRMVACLGDDRAAVGVPDEHHLVGLLVERAPGDGYVVGERGRRVLHDGDCVTGLPQDLVDGLPAGAVDEPTMDENDVGHGVLLFASGRTGASTNRMATNDDRQRRRVHPSTPTPIILVMSSTYGQTGRAVPGDESPAALPASVGREDAVEGVERRCEVERTAHRRVKSVRWSWRPSPLRPNMRCSILVKRDGSALKARK